MGYNLVKPTGKVSESINWGNISQTSTKMEIEAAKESTKHEDTCNAKNGIYTGSFYLDVTQFI